MSNTIREPLSLSNGLFYFYVVARLRALAIEINKMAVPVVRDYEMAWVSAATRGLNRRSRVSRDTY